MFRTIRTKFAVGFFVIFCVSFLLLNQIIAGIIASGNRKIITDDLIGLKNNSGVYVRQAFLINHYASDEIYFAQMAEEMVGDLRHATSNAVSAYSPAGELLYASDKAAFSGGPADDLRHAVGGETAYSVSYEHGTASVLYAYPVVVDGKKVGILRFAKDYSPLYEQSRRILDSLYYIALAVFAAAFLFAYLLSRHVTVPIVKLTKASSQVTDGDLDVNLAIRRRDEVGRLADNFNTMIGKIRGQIATIESDRDRLKGLNAQRKQFFDNVTHELKTPLTSIIGYAEMIRSNGADDPAFFAKGMDHIVQESRRLHELVVHLLEQSNPRTELRADELERLDAARLLRDVCESMTFKAERYGKAIACAADDGLFVEGDADQLRQLFINLIDNAIKYGDAGTEIDVRAEREAGTVGCRIDSIGEPIGDAQLARIFEPFYRGEAGSGETGSVGLGLSIGHAIVGRHGGTIQIESDGSIGRRTTVRVELPYAAERGMFER